jgi:hypothetical protein
MPYYTYYTLFFTDYTPYSFYLSVFIWAFDTFWHNPTLRTLNTAPAIAGVLVNTMSGPVIGLWPALGPPMF